MTSNEPIIQVREWWNSLDNNNIPKLKKYTKKMLDTPIISENDIKTLISVDLGLLIYLDYEYNYLLSTCKK